MERDILVIDIETKNAFFDVGGEAYLHKLDMSVACVYSYLRREFLVFWEEDLPKLGELLKNSRLVVGFSVSRFDLPVLDKYFDFSTRALRRLDLLEEIELACGRRVSLELLAQTNLGCGKTQQNGLEAIRLWNEGKFDELKDYCLNDVRLTRDLYEQAHKNGCLLVPDRQSGENVKIDLGLGAKIKEALDEKTLF
jgi:DEAD/DEAH box helicase domain-containing protein